MPEPQADRAQLAQAVAEAAAAVPGVARLSAGSGVRAATHLAGATVTGVVLGPGRVGVHVVIGAVPVGQVVRAVRHAVSRALAALSVHAEIDVIIEDVDLEDGLPGTPVGPPDEGIRAHRQRATVRGAAR